MSSLLCPPRFRQVLQAACSSRVVPPQVEEAAQDPISALYLLHDQMCCDKQSKKHGSIGLDQHGRFRMQPRVCVVQYCHVRYGLRRGALYTLQYLCAVPASARELPQLCVSGGRHRASNVPCESWHASHDGVTHDHLPVALGQAGGN